MVTTKEPYNPWVECARRFGYTEEIPLNGRRSGWSEAEGCREVVLN